MNTLQRKAAFCARFVRIVYLVLVDLPDRGAVITTSNHSIEQRLSRVKYE
jgi:hypothetical protein